jgi:RND family efflux transporter MFP subunit
MTLAGPVVAQQQDPAKKAPAAAVPPPAAKPAASEPARKSEQEISALVVADDDATLSSQMAGRIKRVHPRIGDGFGKGALLVEFDCVEQEARLLSAQAELLGARETHVSKLRLQGLGAAGELEVTLAAAAVEKSRAQLSVAEAQISFCRVTAPYGGRVARLRVKSFETVAAGQPLMEIVTQSQLRVQMLMPASAAGWVKPGARFLVKIGDTGREYAARVTKLNSRVDAVNQSLEVEGRFEGKTAALLPGMIGTAVFPQRPQ